MHVGEPSNEIQSITSGKISLPVVDIVDTFYEGHTVAWRVSRRLCKKQVVDAVTVVSIGGNDPVNVPDIYVLIGNTKAEEESIKQVMREEGVEEPREDHQELSQELNKLTDLQIM